MMLNRRLVFLIAGLVLTTIIAVVILVVRPDNNSNTQPTTPGQSPGSPSDGPIELTMWGVFDDSAVMQPIIAEYQKANPNVQITYVKKQFADYEKLLVDAIASGEGPDLFVLQNDWLPKHRAKISALPGEKMSAEEYNQLFVSSAYSDFVVDGRIYAVPWYTDNLALYYNMRLFRESEIYDAPATWDDVLTSASILTKTQSSDPTKIAQSGIALGTHNNIARAQDILLALMLQTQTPLISEDRRSYDFNQFRRDPDGTPQYPGTRALTFFTSFADPQKESFSWDYAMSNSVKAFAEEKTAMMLGYSYMAPQLTQLNRSLEFAVAPLPQIRGTTDPVTVANYWAWSVSRNSTHPDVAWDFLTFVTGSESLSEYLFATNRVSPLKSNDAGSSAFAKQANIARTVFKGNSDEFDKILLELIQNVVQYKQPPQISIDAAARAATEMLQRYN